MDVLTRNNGVALYVRNPVSWLEKDIGLVTSIHETFAACVRIWNQGSRDLQQKYGFPEPGQVKDLFQVRLHLGAFQTNVSNANAEQGLPQQQCYALRRQRLSDARDTCKTRVCG